MSRACWQGPRPEAGRASGARSPERPPETACVAMHIVPPETARPREGLSDRTEIVDRTAAPAAGRRRARRGRGRTGPPSRALRRSRVATPARDTAGVAGHAGTRRKGGTMPTEAKQAEVAELVEALSGSGPRPSSPTTAACPSGRPAQSAASCASKGISYRVVKNRLARSRPSRRAAVSSVPLLVGPTALAIGGERRDRPGQGPARRAPTLPRWSSPWRRDRRHARIDAAAVTRLATLPPREMLLAQLAGGMASPLCTMAGAPGRAAAQPRLRPRAAA